MPLLDAAILILLLVWFLMDRCNLYFCEQANTHASVTRADRQLTNTEKAHRKREGKRFCDRDPERGLL